MKIAVVGSGISGLSSALLAGQKYDVTLFESDSRLGGHAHTSTLTLDQQKFNVDTGFLVFNELTYPHLTALFKYLDVEIVDSDMTLSIQVPESKLEWAGESINTVFAQRKNLLRPAFYRLIKDILHFHKNAEALRVESQAQRWTTGEMLFKKKYSEELKNWYILPMIAAIWSTPEIKMLDFPAETFLTFFLNHKLLQVQNRPIWKTVKNGSQEYVKKIKEKLSSVKTNEAVVSVQYNENQKKVEVVSTQNKYFFDKVILATHAPISLSIIKNPTQDQFELLKSFETIKNEAYLHLSPKMMPKIKKCWSAWNVVSNLNNVELTYYLNKLQPLSFDRDIFLTLNPKNLPEKLIHKFIYDHPKFDQKAIDQQKKISQIQGQNEIYLAGAWTRYGFHEDGILSAVNIAKLWDIDLPWKVK